MKNTNEYKSITSSMTSKCAKLLTIGHQEPFNIVNVNTAIAYCDNDQPL